MRRSRLTLDLVERTLAEALDRGASADEIIETLGAVVGGDRDATRERLRAAVSSGDDVATGLAHAGVLRHDAARALAAASPGACVAVVDAVAQQRLARAALRMSTLRGVVMLIVSLASVTVAGRIALGTLHQFFVDALAEPGVGWARLAVVAEVMSHPVTFAVATAALAALAWRGEALARRASPRLASVMLGATVARVLQAELDAGADAARGLDAAARSVASRDVPAVKAAAAALSDGRPVHRVLSELGVLGMHDTNDVEQPDPAALSSVLGARAEVLSVEQAVLAAAYDTRVRAAYAVVAGVFVFVMAVTVILGMVEVTACLASL